MASQRADGLIPDAFQPVGEWLALKQQIGRDIRQWTNHKGSLMGSRVRQRQVGVVRGLAIKPDDIQIERPRSPSNLSFPAMAVFNAVQGLQ